MPFDLAIQEGFQAGLLRCEVKIRGCFGLRSLFHRLQLFDRIARPVLVNKRCVCGTEPDSVVIVPTLAGCHVGVVPRTCRCRSADMSSNACRDRLAAAAVRRRRWCTAFRAVIVDATRQMMAGCGGEFISLPGRDTCCLKRSVSQSA